MEAKDYAYEIVSQLGYGGKLDERITTEAAQQIIERALNNYAELRLGDVVGRSEQFTIINVVGTGEQLKALEDLKDFAYDNCQPHNSDRLTEIMERL